MREIIYEVNIQQIECGGFVWRVIIDERGRRMLQADGNYGECDMGQHIITLDTSLEPGQLSKVFLHEVLEAINAVYLDHKLEHVMLEQLSQGLHQVMVSLGVGFTAPRPDENLTKC